MNSQRSNIPRLPVRVTNDEPTFTVPRFAPLEDDFYVSGPSPTANYPVPSYPSMAPAQKRIRENEEQWRSENVSLDMDIYLHITRENDNLKRQLREKEVELDQLRVENIDLKKANEDLLEKERNGSNEIGEPAQRVVREFYKRLSPSNQYDFEQPLKSERNQRVVEGLQRYLLNRREFSHVTCHAVRKYLAIQFANKKKADKKSREDVDAVTRYQEGRDASKKTRIAKKVNRRKACFDKHRGKGTFDAYPHAEVLLEKAYASDEEDLYSSAVHRAAREELSVLEPGRTEEFTPEEVRGALMNKPLAGFSNLVPRYRSNLFQKFLDELDEQSKLDQMAKSVPTGKPRKTEARVPVVVDVPVPTFISKNGVTSSDVAWAFRD